MGRISSAATPNLSSQALGGPSIHILLRFAYCRSSLPQAIGKIMENVIVITGGSRGIGAATALLAARQGYRICINYHADDQAAETLLGPGPRPGRRAIAVRADVSVEDEIITCFSASTKSSARSPHWSTTPAPSASRAASRPCLSSAC